jgi:hypothetical protein
MDESAAPRRPGIVVFLPGHSLDDFPEDIPEDEAAAVLEAWTAAWHPAVLAAAGLPDWASVELPWRREGEIIGIVPAGFAELFAAGAAAPPDPRQQFLQADESPALRDRLLTALGVVVDRAAAGQQAWQETLLQDFLALGLAVLLGQRLAQKMRAGAEADLEQAGFAEIVQAAATAWQTEGEAVTRERLSEAFGCLEVIRDHFYPVECWCLDLILLSPSTISGLPAELSQVTPAAVLADRETVAAIHSLPAAIHQQLQHRFAAGTLSAVGSLTVDIPLALSTPEHIAGELVAVRKVWHETFGAFPTIFAQQTGPVAPLFPQLLSQAGYSGVLWASFDGHQLPDPASSRFHWQDAAEQVEAVRPRLFDGRRAAAVLSLPVILSDAMDHDHTVVLMACHHAGTASPWFDMLRRLASWTNLFGRFCTPETFLEETDHLAETVRFDRDALPLRITPQTDLPAQEDLATTTREPLASQACHLLAEAQMVLQNQRAAAAVLEEAGCFSASDTALEPQPASGLSSQNTRSWLGLWWPARRQRENPLTLEANGLQLRVHGGTGGIVSLRRGPDGRNRLSQQLAICWPDAAVKNGWQPPPPVYSTMVADSIDRVEETLVSRGRLVDPQGQRLADFTQTVWLDAAMPVIVLEGTIDLTRQAEALAGSEHDPWSRFLACRFAWNENDFCDVERTVQTQLIPTERQRICSPWLVTLSSEGGGLARSGGGHAADRHASRMQLFTGGLPWHLRSSPHTLDTLLATDLKTRQVPYRFALGIDLVSELERAAHWAATGSLVPETPPLRLPSGVRLISAEKCVDEAGLSGLRLRLLESLGRSRVLTLACGQPVCRARRCSESAPRHDKQTSVVVVGGSVEYSLAAYELVDLEIWFGNDHHP